MLVWVSELSKLDAAGAGSLIYFNIVGPYKLTLAV